MLHRLVWVYTCQNATLLEITCHGSYLWMTCGFMRLATLQFEMKLQGCIRMGITIFKIFILGGISSDISLGIMFYGSASVAVKLILRLYIRQYTSPNENFEYSYPLICCMCTAKEQISLCIYEVLSVPLFFTPFLTWMLAKPTTMIFSLCKTLFAGL